MPERCTHIVHKALAVVRPQFRLDFADGIHGLPHWTRVWFHGRALAAAQDVDPARPGGRGGDGRVGGENGRLLQHRVGEHRVELLDAVGGARERRGREGEAEAADHLDRGVAPEQPEHLLADLARGRVGKAGPGPDFDT